MLLIRALPAVYAAAKIRHPLAMMAKMSPRNPDHVGLIPTKMKLKINPTAPKTMQPIRRSMQQQHLLNKPMVFTFLAI